MTHIKTGSSELPKPGSLWTPRGYFHHGGTGSPRSPTYLFYSGEYYVVISAEMTDWSAGKPYPWMYIEILGPKEKITSMPIRPPKWYKEFEEVIP